MAYADGPSPSEHAQNWFDDLLNQNRTNPYLQGIKAIGNFFSDANKNAESYAAKRYGEGGSNLAAAANVDPRSVPQGFSLSADVSNDKGGDFGGGVTGSFTPDNPFMQSGDTGPDPLDELRALLNEKYSGRPLDSSSSLAAAFQAQLAPIAAARQQANDNFAKSDSNLQAMHDAFKKEILAQAPQLQQQNQDYQKNISSIFDQTLKENADRQAADNAQKAEMFQRLGIAPAANQPDLVGQAIEQGNQKTNSSRDSRLAEAAAMGQGNLARNTAAASAVGNDGLQRRSDLARQLQTILGGLGDKEANVSAQFQQNKQNLAQQREQRNYDEFLRERDWNRQRYQDEIGNRMKAQSLGGNTVDGLNNSTDPGVVNAVTDVMANEPNIDIRQPNQVLQAIRKRHPNASPEELQAAFNYITQYNKLGTNKASAFH